MKIVRTKYIALIESVFLWTLGEQTVGYFVIKCSYVFKLQSCICDYFC